MILTKQYIDKHKTGKGGWTKKKINALGVDWPPTKGWKQRLIGTVITDEKAAIFEGRKNAKPEVINSMSTNKKDDWAWKPDNKDIPAIKVKSSKKNKNRGKNKKRRARISKADNQGFYHSDEWRELRVRVLEKYECKCMMCGRSPQEHGIVIHCDHIKPRSKRPDLSLTFDNLQLLCADCNLGKSNKYSTDWRPALNKQEQIAAALDMELLANSPLN